MNKWQPIATAPKDGTFVILAEWSGYTHMAQWCCDGYWRFRIDDEDLEWTPTHWMPMPRGPVRGRLPEEVGGGV